MSTELIIAIVASGTSLLVAITTLIISIISNRHSARSMKELEIIKHEFSHTRENKAIANAHVDESLTALQNAIQSIQLVKDEIQLILSTVAPDPDHREP